MAGVALSSDQMARNRTDLAGMRTLMGADRTLMAWIRTSLSLLSFGFTIYKVLQGLQEHRGTGGHQPRDAGLVLTAMGTLAMVMGTIEYWKTLNQLRCFQEVRRGRFPMIMAVFMSLAGLFLFSSILVRLL